MNKKTIFSDFNLVSAKAWKQKIQMDLKGADYNQTLLTNSLDGITIQPFYHQDTFKSLPIPPQKSLAKICETLFIDDEKIVNHLIKESLQKGAESIKLIAKNTFDYKTLFADLNQNIEVLIFIQFNDNKYVLELIKFLNNFQNTKLIIDIINHFASDGNWYSNQKEDFNTLIKNAQNTSINIGIDASLYQNAGANNIQQLAYTLAHVNEYLNNLNHKTTFTFSFAIGSQYFFEIAKIRAFRYLINKLFAEYSLNHEFNIVLEPTLRNKTLYDYNVNLLRTATENMASMLCGADYISSLPYDAIYHKSNEFGARIARNQLLILKEESYFNQEKDLSKGTYYIEQITYELADKALKLFKEIERNGGFIAQLQKGSIQRKIEESATKEQTLFDKGELVLLGTNKYPNPLDKMKNELELFPFTKIKPRKTIIKPIIPKRLAEKIEKERLVLEG